MNIRTKFDQNLEKLLSQDDIDLDSEEDEEVLSPFEIISYEEVSSSIAILDEDTPEEKDRKEDYKYSRTIYRGILDRGISALELALIMARESDHPKAFEAVSKLMKEIASTNKDLIELHSIKNNKQVSNKVVTNNTQVNNYNISNDKSKIESFLDDATYEEDYEEKED